LETNTLAISRASSTRPPPFARRSSTIPRAGVQLAVDRFAQFAMRSGAERRERDDAELLLIDGLGQRCDDGL